MKKTITFLATVAFSCCGISTSFAQIQISTGQPTLTPILVSSQTETAEVGDSLVQETVPNPFDFFLEEPIANASGDGLGAPEDLSPSDADPASLPVGRHHRNRSVVETVIDHATISGVPHAAMAPVYWNGPARTPNPIADILLREECNVRELWAGYPAQRAAECADMWNRINSHHGGRHHGGRHHGCNSCSQSSCNASQPVNRYTQQTLAPACDHLPSAPCTQCSSANAGQFFSPQTAVNRQSQPGNNKVAFLPVPALR